MKKQKGMPKLNADLRELVRTNAECYGDKVLYIYKEDGEEKTVTYNENWNRMNALGTAFSRIGLMGETIAVIGEAHPLYMTAYYAVTCGGGTNHRMGMYDRVLMKDNHRRLWKGGNPDELDQAVAAARRRFPKLEVEVEVETIRECESALKAKPEWIMLDNMSIADMKKCVKLCKGISKTEASGGITLERAKEVAATGVTAISLGCLTHSAGSVDLSLEWKSV